MPSNSIICPPSGDSPLSVTSNIIGILTFVYVLVVGIWYRIATIRSAAQDLKNFIDEFSSILGRHARKYDTHVRNKNLDEEISKKIKETLKLLSKTLEVLGSERDRSVKNLQAPWRQRIATLGIRDAVLFAILGLRRKDRLKDDASAVRLKLERLSGWIEDAE
ncbi:hypothetical protein CC80DRAFT_548733 [Byssothecium circinans]|uniref:Uncharacterized protein n=1 Tax=Byssothecium circinans TaxID=147558 RepID=A0A6A5TWK9_9PLEO|nr:hypothetical protein CC80DRAFT_548733 [Byssothecium circinans]